jgi:hypothetical protein
MGCFQDSLQLGFLLARFQALESFFKGLNSLRMKHQYQIYVLGDIPSDLKERIVAIHAAGILKGSCIFN